MKLSCAFVLALTNLVIASPFSLSVKGSGTSGQADATAVPGTFGLVHHVASTTEGYSGSSPSSSSLGFTPSSLNSGAFNYNSGHVHDLSEYSSPGEVSHNIASIPKVPIAEEKTHTNVKNFENTEASESYYPHKTNDYSANSASYFQYQPSSLESKPSSLSGAGHLTLGGTHENSKHNVFITYSKQSEKADKFKQSSEQQSLPCQTFNNVSPFPTLSNANKEYVIAEKRPVYNGGFGGPSGILNPDYKATYTGSNSFPAQQSTIETVKSPPQSLSNGYTKPSSERDVSGKPTIKLTANIKPLNNEKTNKEQFVTSSLYEQVDYIKDKNTQLYTGVHLPSASEHTGENLLAPTLNVSKPIQNFQIFVQPYYDNVNIQDKKTYAASEKTDKIKQTQEPTYTGSFGAPVGILKPFSQPQTGGHTFVPSGKLEQHETKTNDVTSTTNTQESGIIISGSPLNEVKLTGIPFTESINYHNYENAPAVSHVTQKPSSPIYDEQFSVSSDSPAMSASSNKISPTNNHAFAVINAESQKEVKIPNEVINQSAFPALSVASEINTKYVPSQQSIPNLPIPSTNVGTVSFESTLATFAQQTSYTPSIKNSSTGTTVLKVSENPKLWPTEKLSSVDYSFSTQKPTNFGNPTVSVVSQVNSNHVSSQQYIPNLPLSSTNVGSASVESTLATIAQQTSHGASQETTVNDSSVSKISENSNVSSSENPSSINYSFSTQKPNNFANPIKNVASQVNSIPVKIQHQFNSILPNSLTQVAAAHTESTLATLAQQPFAPSIENSPTDTTVPKVPKVWSENPSSIDYNFSTQKLNTFSKPTASVLLQVHSNQAFSQQYVPYLPIPSTNIATESVESTLPTFAQQSSYATSIKNSQTGTTVPKVSVKPKVWPTENPSSIDYSFSTPKPNTFVNPAASVLLQVNSNHVPSQLHIPNLPLSSTNVGTASVESTLATNAQQSSYGPSQETTVTHNSDSKVSENSKVWSTDNPSFINYSFSTQKPNKFANPITNVASHVNSIPVKIQHFSLNLPNSLTQVGTAHTESTLATFEQQSSYAPSIENSQTGTTVLKVSEKPQVWSSENPSSIDYSFSTKKPNNFANPTASVVAQVNSNQALSQQFIPILSIPSTNIATASVEATLPTFVQQTSYAPSIENSSSGTTEPKVSENPEVWLTEKPSSVDYSFSTQKPNNFANPTASVVSQVNSNQALSQQFIPNLSTPSTNIATASVESTLPTFAQQTSYASSIENSSTGTTVLKVSEKPRVWSSENPSSIDYSFSTQKPYTYANPTASVVSQINSNHIPSQQYIPNLPLPSTNIGTASVESTLATIVQQSSYAPSIGISLTDGSVPKATENSKVNPETLGVSHVNFNSYNKDSQSESSPALIVSKVTANKPLYSNTFGTLSGAVKPTGYSHLNSFPSSTSNSKYNPGLITVSSDKQEQNNYFNQHKPSPGSFQEKTTILSSSYTTDSIYVSTAKPHITLASLNTVQKSTELNEKNSKVSSSLDSDTIYPKPTERPKQQLNNSGVFTGSLFTSRPVKPTDSKISVSSVLPTSEPVFGTGLSQSTPQYQYTTVHPANQKKQWHTNTFETYGGVKPQNSYTYPGFTSSFTNFGHGSSIVANKQFNKIPSTGQYKPYSIGQYNPTSTGQYVPSSTGYYNPISTGQYKPSSAGQYNPIATGQYKPTSTGQYNPTLIGQYTPYNWGSFRQPVTLKPFGLLIPTKEPIVPASTPTTDKPLEKLKPNNNFSVLNKKEPSFTTVFTSPIVSQSTLKPIPSAEITYAPVTEGPSIHNIEDYSEGQKITALVSTTPKTSTQKPWLIGTQATTDKANNLSGNSVPVISLFTNSVNPTVAPFSVVPSNNLPSNVLSSDVNLKESSYINNFGVVSSNLQSTGQSSHDHRDISTSEKILSTTSKSISPIKQTSSGKYVAQTASSLLAGSVNTENSQLTTSNYENQQTLNQNRIQLDSLSTGKPSQETYDHKTVYSSEGTSSIVYDTSSPKPTNVPLFTSLNFPSAKVTSILHKSGDSTVVLKPPKGLLENTVQNQSSAFNNINIVVPVSESNDKAEVKDQVTSNSGFQHDPTVLNNSFKPLNSAVTSNPLATPGLTFSSKPEVQSIESQKDLIPAENQAKLDGNVKPITQSTSTNLHYSTNTKFPASILNSSNQQKDSVTVSLSAQLGNAGTVYQKPEGQHSSANIGPSQVDSQYLGRFGGPSGILKPHDFSGPSIHANVPFQNNLSHFNQPASTINSGVKAAEDSKSVSYLGGFGGPSGVLTPDNSKKQTGIPYAGQDKQWSNVQTSGFHGSLTSHNLSPGAPFVGIYANNKKQNVYGLHAATANSQGLSSSNVDNHNNQQQRSDIPHGSGNSKSSSSLSGQFRKLNGLATSGSVESSTGAETGLFGSKRPLSSGLTAAHGSSGFVANTGHGRKIF